MSEYFAVGSKRGITLLLVAWAVSRGVLLASTLSGQVPLDILAYARWADQALSGLNPADDLVYVYPPGSLVVFIGSGVLGPDLYFRFFTLVATLMDLVILIALVIAVRRREASSLVAPWMWVVMGFAVGPIMYERFDIFPAVLSVLAVLAVSRPGLVGSLSAVGALIKLWPEISILGAAREKLARALIINLIVLVSGWGLLHVIFGDSFGFVGNVLNKSVSVEAVAAYPFLLLRQVFGTHGVRGQFGSWEVIGPGVVPAGTLMSVFGIVLLALLLVLRIRGRFDRVAPGDVVLLGVLIFVATHKINSLQYGVWIAAMAAVALSFPGSRSLGPSILLTLMLIVTGEVIWQQFVPFISGNPILIAFQGLRLALLLAALVWLARSLLRAPGLLAGTPGVR